MKLLLLFVIVLAMFLEGGVVGFTASQHPTLPDRTLWKGTRTVRYGNGTIQIIRNILRSQVISNGTYQWNFTVWVDDNCTEEAIDYVSPIPGTSDKFHWTGVLVASSDGNTGSLVNATMTRSINEQGNRVDRGDVQFFGAGQFGIPSLFGVPFGVEWFPKKATEWLSLSFGLDGYSVDELTLIDAQTWNAALQTFTPCKSKVNFPAEEESCVCLCSICEAGNNA